MCFPCLLPPLEAAEKRGILSQPGSWAEVKQPTRPWLLLPTPLSPFPAGVAARRGTVLPDGFQGC